MLRWALERDGLPVQRGRLSAPLAPGQKGLLAVPLKALPPSPGSELCLRVRVEQGQGTEAVPKGWVFREASFPLAKGPKLRLSRVPRRSWEDGPRGPTLVLEDGLTARFDGVTGALKSLGRGEGAPWLSALAPSLWRAPMDNDGIPRGSVPRPLRRWRGQGLAALATRLEAVEWRGDGVLRKVPAHQHGAFPALCAALLCHGLGLARFGGGARAGRGAGRRASGGGVLHRAEAL